MIVFNVLAGVFVGIPATIFWVLVAKGLRSESKWTDAQQQRWDRGQYE